MFQKIVIAGCCLLASGVVLAHKDEKDVVEYRQSVMNLVAANFKPMGSMLKGKEAWDSAVFAGYANDLASVTSLNQLRGYPKDVTTDKSAAKMEIWENWDDFKTKMENLQSAAQKLKEVAAYADKDTIQQSFAKTADTCKACHKEYKQKH